MTNLRLEKSFSDHQLVMLGCGIIAFAALAYTKFNLYGWSWASFMLALPFIAIMVVLIGVFFLQNGFTARSGNRVARTWFWFGIPVRMKTINSSKFPIISTLKMGKRQKLAFSLAANPDLAVRYDAYDITSLNKNHRIKERLMSLKKEHNAKNAMAFILNHSDLKEEIYSPDFSS